MSFVQWLKPFRNTPFHPQWFVNRDERSKGECLFRHSSGLVADIGCSDQSSRKSLSPECHYLGVDYFYTATQWYGTQPGVYADGQQLPFRENSIDTVLLLDVLEHLPEPGRCLTEIHRVLKAGSCLILQVPFLYPIHDAPLDFQRWTLHGLRQLAAHHRFEVVQEVATGHQAEVAALLLNLAVAKTMLNWLKQRNPLAILAVLLPFSVLVINLLGWLLAKAAGQDIFMAHGYRMVLRKCM